MKLYERDKIPEHNRVDPVVIPRAELIAWIGKEKWYQTISFSEDISTPGSFDSEAQIDSVLLHKDMSGMRYLDIGSNQGFQVMSAAMRGAEAFGIDNKKNQVLKARRIAAHFGIRADFTHCDIFDTPERYAEYRTGFDYMTMMSVFHHFRKPLLALDIVRGMCRGQMLGEFCCWIKGEKRWLMARKFPSDWGDYYHKAYPTLDCCVAALEERFSRVTVLGPVKTKWRIAILSEV
jgi:hypothetical protein